MYFCGCLSGVIINDDMMFNSIHRLAGTSHCRHQAVFASNLAAYMIACPHENICCRSCVAVTWHKSRCNATPFCRVFLACRGQCFRGVQIRESAFSFITRLKSCSNSWDWRQTNCFYRCSIGYSTWWTVRCGVCSSVIRMFGLWPVDFSCPAPDGKLCGLTIGQLSLSSLLGW